MTKINLKGASLCRRKEIFVQTACVMANMGILWRFGTLGVADKVLGMVYCMCCKLRGIYPVYSHPR